MRPVALAMVAVLYSAAAEASDLRLAIRDGRVWLTAADVTIAQILQEWSRVGQTQVMNADALPSGRLTIVLDAVPERQALDEILRSAGGYLASVRTGGSPGSVFDRIIVSQRTALAPQILAPPARGPDPETSSPLGVSPAHVLPEGVTPVLGPDGRPIPDDQVDAPPPAIELPRAFAVPESAPRIRPR